MFRSFTSKPRAPAICSVAAVAYLAVITSPLADAAESGLRAGSDASFEVISSAAQFVETYPDWADRLFARLDLDYPGLEDVRAALEADDKTGAAVALLAYYRQADTARWLIAGGRVHDPGGFDDHIGMSAAALEDRLTLQNVSGQAKRTDDGRLDWYDRGPKGDLQWAVFLNRHFHLLPLLYAYQETGNTAYVRRIDETLQDWVVSNYPEEEAETDKLLPANWKPMTTASRLLQVWPHIFFNLRNEPAMSDAGLLLMLSSVPAQMDHLKRYHRRKHNHAVKEMIGLAHAAAAFPELKGVDEWHDYAQMILTEELDRQLYPTGVQKEVTAHYQRTVLEYFLQYVEFMRSADKPRPAVFEKRIEDMRGYLARAIRPGGTIPLTNDSDLDNVRDLVLHLADVFRREDWRYIATNGRAGEAPKGAASAFYPYAGQLIVRSGWDEDALWAFFDAGPYGISHQQRDKLHVSVSRGGQDLIVDTGRYRYNDDDPLRQYVLSSEGHNVILIDGRQQNAHVLERQVPRSRAAYLSDAVDVAFGTFDAGFEGLEGTAVHHRALARIAGVGVVVADYVVTDRPRKIAPLWHFHPDVGVELRGGGASGRTNGSTRVLLAVDASVDWSVQLAKGKRNPVSGWYSPFYNKIEPAPLVRYSATIEGNRGFGWLIQTGKTGDELETPLTLTRLPSPQGSVRLLVGSPAGGGSWEIGFRFAGDSGIPLADGATLDGAFAVKHPDGSVTAVGGVVRSAEGSIVARGDWTY